MEGNSEGFARRETIAGGNRRHGNEADGARRRTRTRGAQHYRRARTEIPAAPARSERRQERDRGNSGWDRRRRSLAFCRRTFPHVLAVRGIAELEGGNSGELGVFHWRNEGNCSCNSGEQSLFQVEI